jgi:cell division protein FtsB
MAADFNVWDKLTRVVIFLLFIAYLLVVGVWYFPLIQQNERYRKAILADDVRFEKEEERFKQLRSSIEALRRDPKAFDRMTRERLGYGKPGETIIRFEAPVTNTTPRP